MSKALTELQKSIGKHSLLGSIVYWSFHDVDIPADELQMALNAYDLDLKVANVSDRRALTKALGILKRASKDKLIDKIIEDEDQVVYAVLDKAVDYKEMELNVENLNAVIFDKATKILEFKKNGDAISTEVEELFYSLRYI